MTTKVQGAALSVPAPEEIAFPALRRTAFVVLANTTAPAAAEAAAARLGGTTVSVAPVAPGFVSFDGIAHIFDALGRTVRREAPQLLGDATLPDGTSLLDPREVGWAGISHLAEAVTFAVTRRISRESHQSALLIDRIARTLLEIHRRCPSLREGLTLLVPHLERWDRPSLRCLYRAVLLQEPADRLGVVATTAPTCEDEGRDLPARIRAAHESFVARLAHGGVVEIRKDAPALGPSRRTDGATLAEGEPPPQERENRLLTMGDALVLQNYERVYHLAHEVLKHPADPEQEAQTRRLVGIAHAQLDDPAAAVQELERASRLTANPAFAAHLHYLQGLIDSKRTYDLGSAEAHYTRGLAVLDAAGPGSRDTPEWTDRRVERAWLFNGQALIKALQAKAASDTAEADRLLGNAFALEFAACDLVRGSTGAAPAYLRHNLMANLTFLLEISHRFGEAVTFWRRAFEPYLAADSHEFRTSFGARMGLLLFKAGDRSAGITTLEAARLACTEASDPFGEEELWLKLGYAYGAGVQLEAAYDAYSQSLRIGRGLREADVCVEALTGMLWCLAEMEATEELQRLREAVLAAVPGTELARRLVEEPGNIALPRPSPKLRAYIPAVDLEGTPAQDLNRYLVWGRGGLPPRSGQAGLPGNGEAR